MCWVIPPASPAATSVSRIASSSDVLPWSTWPMIVTTGGRGSSSLVLVVEDGLADQLVGGVHDLDLLAELGGEHADRLVGQRLRQRRHLAEAHQLADHLGHGDAEVLGDALDRRAGVDPDQVGRAARGLVDRRHGVVVGAAPTPSAPRRAPHRLAGRAAGLAARGLRVDDDAPASAGSTAPGRCSPVRESRVGRERFASAARAASPGEDSAASSAAASGSGAGAAAVGWCSPCVARRPHCRGGCLLAVGGCLLAVGGGCRAVLGERREREPSSTLDAAALASMPAACSLASSSLVGTPWSLAISCTRFFAISRRFYGLGVNRHRAAKRALQSPRRCARARQASEQT